MGLLPHLPAYLHAKLDQTFDDENAESFNHSSFAIV